MGYCYNIIIIIIMLLSKPLKTTKIGLNVMNDQNDLKM